MPNTQPSPVARLLALSALTLSPFGLASACGGVECRQQGECGPDAYCASDYTCVPLEEVAPGATDVQRWGPDLSGGGARAEGQPTAWSTTSEDAAVQLVEIGGALGTWPVTKPTDELDVTLSATELVEGEWWNASLTINDGAQQAMAFFDVDQLVLPSAETPTEIMVTVCSDRYEDGFHYDELTTTEGTLRPADGEGYLLEVEGVDLVGAEGPLSATLWFDAL